MLRLQLCFISMMLFPLFSKSQLTVTVTPQTQCFSTGINTVSAIAMSGPSATAIYSWSVSTGTIICASGNTIASFGLTLADAVVYFGCCGTYTINCFALSSGFSILASTSVVVTLSCPTDFSVSASPTLVCSESPSTLSATGSGSYTWSTGANGSQAVVSPTATTVYTVSGTFTTGCPGVTTRTVAVNVFSPTFQVSPPSASICSGNSVTFSASGASSYTWNTGTGPGIAFSSLTITPTASTIYTVAATSVSNNVICVATKTVGVSLTNSITVTAFATPTVVCGGSPVVLFAQGAAGYTWSTAQFGPTVTVLVPLTSPQATYAVVGASGPCVSNTVMLLVQIIPLPSVSVIPGTTTVCMGDNLVLTATGALSYTWSNNVVAPSLTLTPLLGTTYSVTGTAANACTNTASCSLMVNPLPTLSIVSGSNPVCSGKTVTLAASGAQTYSWSTAQVAPSITLQALSGTYSVSGTGANGCKNIATYNLVTFPAPTVGIVASSNPVCPGKTVTLTAGGAQTYSWSTNQVVATITVNAIAGTYSVTGFGANNCSDTASLLLVVQPSPSITAVSNTSVICNGEKIILTPGGGSSYTWSPIAGAGSLTLSPTTTTQYTLTGENTFSCTNTAVVTVTVNKCQGIFDLEVDEQVKVYPNPACDHLFLETPEHATITVFNIDGQVLFRKALKGTHHKIDISSLIEGCYFLSIQSVSALKTIRFVKE